jgi:hypothetical protein
VARVVYAVALATVMTVATHAHAQNGVTSASAEYQAGAAAYDKKDYTTAAQHLSRADEMVPNPTVLKLAMVSCLNINDSDPAIAPLAMSLVERAEQRGADAPLAQVAKKLRQKYADAAGRVKVTCPAGLKCQATVDGKDVEMGIVRWVTPGTHKVQVRADNGGGATSDVRVNAGGSITVTPTEKELAPPANASPTEPTTAPAAATSPVPPDKVEASEGLPPIYFWLGAGATVVGAGVTTVFALQNSARHEEFLRDRSDENLRAAGDAAQLRMGAAAVVTGALLVSTVVLFLLTDFHGASAKASARR